jgi:phospholipase/lecithinase/hemolysin
VSAVAQGEGGELPFTEFVVFGDSLSDDATRGAWQLTHQAWPADGSYFEGRFSKCVSPSRLRSSLGFKVVAPAAGQSGRSTSRRTSS